MHELHRIHHPVCWTQAPPREPPALSAEQLAAFARDGFLAPLDVLTTDEVAELRRRLTRLGERLDELEPRLYEVETAWRERPAEVVLHLLGAWMIDEWFHDLVFQPSITQPLARLLGVDRLRFWHDQVFWKPPRHPGVVPWHQDYSYWTRTAPACHITLFLALDDMDEHNGALQYVPGSQRLGLLPRVAFGGARDQLLPHLPPHCRIETAQTMTLRAGQAAVHHSHTVHGSGANRSDRPRRAIVLNYMGPHVRVADASAPLLRNTAPLPLGAIVSGDHFPIVHPLPG